MKRGQDLRERIREDQEAHRQRVQDNRDHFAAAMSQLKQVDPNWETWYDNESCIPDEWKWVDAEPLIAEICARLLAVTGVPFRWEREVVYVFDWTVRRPAKRGKRKVTVTILEAKTKKEFAEWWKKYAQAGWTAKVCFRPIQTLRSNQ